MENTEEFIEKRDNFDIGPLSLLTKTVKSNA